MEEEEEEEESDKLTLRLLDSIDSYAAVQEVITKRLADIIYLLSREKFHVRSGSERLDVLVFDQRPHSATLKCVESSLNSVDATSLSKDFLTWNIRKWSPVSDFKENSQSDFEEFCLSPTLKEARKMSRNLISLTLEAVNIQIEINHLLEKLSEYPPLSEDNDTNKHEKVEQSHHH